MEPQASTSSSVGAATESSTWSFVETGRQLELQLAKLQRQLAEQESLIARVETKLDDFVTKETHEHSLSIMNSRLDRVEQALQDLKQLCHIPNHTGTSIGEAVAANMSSIDLIRTQVSKRATLDELEAISSEIRAELTAQTTHLEETKASKAFVNS